MFDNEIFVFGSKIFPDIKRDALSSLPLELSWRIFSYLDNVSLSKACRVTKLWRRIILSCRKLRLRLNRFELVFRLGSENLARFYRNHRRRLKRAKHYMDVQETTVEPVVMARTEKVIIRKGDDFVVFAKRFKTL